MNKTTPANELMDELNSNDTLFDAIQNALDELCAARGLDPAKFSVAIDVVELD